MKNIVLIISATLLTACVNTDKNNANNNAEASHSSNSFIKVSQDQFNNGKMKLGTIETRPFLETVEVNGMIDVPPENKAVVSATMGGYIKSTPLLIGNRVKKGQLLATIENPDFITLQQEYLEAKEQLTYLKNEFERQTALKTENITSEKKFLRAESEYKTTMARYASLKKQLAMINISAAEVEKGNISTVVSIYSPINGSVTQIYVSKGSYISPASPILEVINNEHIHLELSVFEKDIMKIKKGQEIQFRIPEASDSVFLGEVYLIGTSIDPNRTIKVHGHLKNEAKNQFLTGMFVTSKIVIGSTEKYALPSEAIVSLENKAYTLQLEKKENEVYYFKQTEIATGNHHKDYISITNYHQLPSESYYLTKGAYDLIGE